MKKRVLSMFMALALCLTLLPAPAWAAEADAPEGGAAQVTTAGGTEQVYGSFNDAWSAAIESEGSTLKLLSDVELPEEVGEDGLPVSEGSFTLDLNNKTLKGAIWKQLLEVSGTANITIKNGSLVNTQTGSAGTASSTNLVALKISGGTVALDNVNLTSGINSEGNHSSALYITGGSLTVTGSTFTGEVGVFCENSGTRPALSIADATLNNGIFYWVADAQASDTAGLEAIFADGSMLFEQDGKYIDLSSKEYWHIENFGAIFLYTKGCIVKPHTHKVENGACECGATFAASVTQNGTVTYYKDFHTALDAAKAGDTLTLLADVQGDVTATIDKAITFDLNGHKIYDLTVECKIILKDSAGGTGKIAEWLRVDNGLHIGDLLEEGYALRNAGTGAWYGETEQTVGNVTVQQAPITSVTLTALNADGTDASTSIPYGTTNGIKLSASCDAKPGAGKLSCQWYTTGGTLQLINGATEPVYQLPADLSVGEYTYRVTFTADGYSKSADITITITATNKIVPTGEPTLSATTLTYGQALSAIKLSGKLHDNVNNKDVEGTFTWADGTVKPSAGSYEAAWKFTPTDGNTYAETTGTVSITGNKAKPTGDPIYTRITAANKTLKDANLKSNTSWPTGTIQWVDKDGKELENTTEVKANTAYKWIFTPTGADAGNYTTATGELTLYSVSTGGGGGGGSSSGSTRKTETTTKPDGTKVETVTKPDGTTIKTETKKDGSVSKTETKKDGTKIQTETKKDGSTVKTETKKDGSSVTENKAANGSTGTVKTDKNGQTTAETALSSKAIEDAKKSGEPVKAPVEVEASRDSNTAPTVKVELPKGAGETKVEIPVSNVKPGTVAVLVHPDGTEEIVKNSLPTEDGIQLTVNGGATVKIVDNSKDFADTRNHWAKDAIDFVSARGLVNGMNDSIYAPNASTTRAQLWTILARQNDADLNGGNTWYEKAQLWSKDKGVSDGANPNGTIDRAQMVTMLWRAAGQPTAGGTANFTDVPADSYYANAVSWAVEGGITAGVGGGRFDPNSTCTRGQIATFLWRAMAE